MSANLAADIISIAIIYLIGRRFVNRNAANRVIVSAEFTLGFESIRGRIDNLSPEPIYAIVIFVEKLGVREATWNLTPEDGEEIDYSGKLLTGETKYTEWFTDTVVPISGDRVAVDVRFHTIRGSYYTKRVFGPKLTLRQRIALHSRKGLEVFGGDIRIKPDA